MELGDGGRQSEMEGYMKDTALLLGLELLAGFEKLGKLEVGLGHFKASEEQAPTGRRPGFSSVLSLNCSEH